MGIPSWNIGDLVIEPIVTIGLLLAFFMFGIYGLIFGAVLFAVSRWSTNGAPEIVTRLPGHRQRGDLLLAFSILAKHLKAKQI